MKETLQLHASQRKTYYDTIQSCELHITELNKERTKVQKLVTKEEKKWQHASRKQVQAREKKKAEQEERRRERREKKPETQPIVFRVRITIEVPPPTHIDSGKAKEEPPAEEGEATASAERPAEFVQDATLTLSYTTSSASWTPHYDLRLDTANPARSTITYRAHFINRTYETWSNAQITLSTSQASFGGLNEKVPRMESWRVNLVKAWHSDVQRRGMNGLFSLAEQKIKEGEQRALYEVANQQINQFQRSQFMPGSANVTKSLGKAKSLDNKKSGSRRLASSAVLTIPTAAPVSLPWSSSGVQVFGGRSRSRSPSGSSPPQPSVQLSKEELDEKEKYDVGGGGGDVEGGEVEVDGDGLTLAPGGNLIAHAAVGADTYGFTTTYELPTPRTIPSTELIRRHVIAEIPLPNLMFTHIIIPKLKAAAFLKARVNNSSNIPLLPGVAGLTLDGSFLGNLSFPRCSPDETIVLELGVDQSVKVEYERPVVKRGSQGMIIMGKEEVGAFKRTMRITNTKGVSVSLVVLDQVPVPEDEKLKVIITSPKGLRDVDDVVRSGVGVDGKAPTVKPRKPKAPEHAPSPSVANKQETVSESQTNNSLRSSIRRFPSFSKRDRNSISISAPVPPLPITPVAANAVLGTANNWGTAKATLRKNGEIRFDVDLLKGGCVSIDLEWESRMPNGEGIYALS
jgi:hypothetical protein